MCYGGEQPLPKNGACNLSSINISEYVKNPFTDKAIIDYSALEQDIYTIVAAMDDIVSENIKNHALVEQQQMAEKYRNIGIGIMSLHDTFIKLGVMYGSQRSIEICSCLMNRIFRTALYASIDLGEKRGNFPGYNPKVWDANIIKNCFMPTEIEEFKKQNTLRNCSLLSIAPTGSIGTMWNVSTGIEPWFNTHYIRNTKSLKGEETSYEVWAPVIKEAKDRNWHIESCITANDIPWQAHIEMQAAAQEYVDTSISKTINLPANTSPRTIFDIYLHAWYKGLKGCTVYVDGSRDPILSTDNKSTQNKLNTLVRGQIVKAGNECIGLKEDLTTGCGTLHVQAFFDPKTGELRETYLSKGSTGGCNSYMVALSRMMSLAARTGTTIDNIIDQLKSTPTCPSYASRTVLKHDTSKGSSCPCAIGYALKKLSIKFQQEFGKSGTIAKDFKIVIDNNPGNICPECGAKLEHIGGCDQCPSCGYSRCD